MLEIFTDIKNELLVMFISMVPVIEIKGAIPTGILLGFSLLHSTIISTIGNMIPIPFLLLLLKPIMEFLEGSKYFGKLIDWIRRRTLRKSEKIYKYSLFGLFLLVAIPLPTTGVYTGCVAASLLNIRFKYAFPTITLGAITAGVLIYFLFSLGIWGI